jgi:hypothetical protein
MHFYTNGGSGIEERMRIGSSGDVKITTNGKFLQGVRNTGSATIDMIGFASGTDTLQIKGGTSGAANAISFYDTGGFLGTWYNSNFGIGTTLPQAQLHINEDTSNSYATLRLEGANRGGIIEMYNQTSYPVSSWTTDQSGNIFFATSGAFAATSLSTKFTILTGGNVGIGETSPNAKLDVPGNVKLGSAAHSSWTDAKQDVGGLDVFVGSGSNAFQVWDDNQQTYPRFKVERAGNVGIGNSPASDAKLEVWNGNLRVRGDQNAVIQLTNVAGNTKSQLGNAGNEGDLSLYTSGNIKTVYLSSYYDSYINPAGGNVGIGTTSPGAKLEVKEGHTILGGTQNNYGGNVYTTKLGGYGVLSTGTDRYGSYGWLTFNSNNNYTGGARAFAFTNGYQANQFALLIGTSDQAPPTLGAEGDITNGQLIFHVNNSADFMFGKVAGDGNGPHLQVNSYSYSSTFQGSSTGDMVTYKTGTELNTNVGALVFRDNGNDYCGQITVNGSTNTTSYLSASDYRLKEDLKDFNGIDLVDKIPVYNFKWKKENVRTFGVLAHELKEVLPLAVNGDKDEEKYQTVDYSKIVPVLIKAIQELKAEIELLKTQINT